MAKFDLKGLTKQVKNAAGGVVKGISNTAQKLPDISNKAVGGAMKDVSGAVKDVTLKGQAAINSIMAKKISPESLKEAALERDPEEMLEEISDGAYEGTLKDDADGSLEETLEEAEAAPAKQVNRAMASNEKDLSVSIEGALQIIYYLMTIDGEISAEEKEKLREIALELGVYEYKIPEEQEKTYVEAARDAESPEEYYDILHDKVGEVIASTKTEKGGVRGKLLIWDLYVLAYSDGNYSEQEKRLIKYICRMLCVDRVLAMEMEQSLRTIQAIETEELWLDGSDREYRKVEERKNELADRKKTVMKGIRFLISD